MKTKNTFFTVAGAIILLLNPFKLNAQWSAVRYDQHNIFHNVSAPTSNTVFANGIEPTTSQYFIIRTNDAGNNWDSISFNSATDTFVLTQLYFFDVSTGFAGGTKNGNQVLLKTTDNGNSWTEITPNPSSTDFISSVHFIDAQNGVATDGAFLYKTTNGGTAWTPEASPFIMSGLFFEDMNNGFACGNNGPAEVMQTSDGGQNWNTVLSAYDSNLFVSSFAKMDFINSNVGFTAMENSAKFFRTLDGGNSWQPIVIDSVQAIRDFDFISADTGHVLVEMVGWLNEYRILLTVDGGQNWTMEYTTGWNFYGGGVVLNACSFVDQTGYTTGSNGLVKKYSPSTAGISEEELNGTTRVYPNPAGTTLHVTLWDNKRIVVTNVLGEIMMEKMFTGKNATDIDVSSLSPGIYFVKAGNKASKFVKE
jgi:photosystem II stability/assembly factor-like uncharacterized protein